MSELLPDKPYFPSRGINIDSNSVLIRPEEAIDCLNMDISGSQIKSRAGTIELDPYTDTSDAQPDEPILHYHEYIVPGGNTKLFAFTATDI